MGRHELNLDMLNDVNGGNIGFNVDANGNYTMKGQYTGKTFYGVSLANVMEIAKYAATIPNTPEGEQQIIDWASSKGFI